MLYFYVLSTVSKFVLYALILMGNYIIIMGKTFSSIWKIQHEWHTLVVAEMRYISLLANDKLCNKGAVTSSKSRWAILL